MISIIDQKDLVEFHDQIPKLGEFIDFDNYLDKYDNHIDETTYLIAKGFADIILSDLQGYMIEFDSCLFTVDNSGDDLTLEELYIYRDRIKIYYDIISASNYSYQKGRSIWRFIDTTIYDLWISASNRDNYYDLDGILKGSDKYKSILDKLNSLIKEKENGIISTT